MQKYNCFLPEGSNFENQQNALAITTYDDAIYALQRKLPLEAQVIRCDTEHNLHLRVGAFDAVLMRQEAIHPDISGATREISIISKVGKFIDFHIIEIHSNSDGGINMFLSRKSIQSDALDFMFSENHLGNIISATITHLAPFGAFADIGCGIIALLPLEYISVSRISHPSERFFIGQNIYAVISKTDCSKRRIWLSHRELLGTFEENAKNFSVGETVCGTVRGVMDYGIFVELAPNLCGLAENCENIELGQRVSVFIKSIQAEKSKVKLQILEKLPPSSTLPEVCYTATSGRIDKWQYTNGSGKKIFSDFTFS